MIKYEIARAFIENHRVLFDPYMHKALSYVIPQELSTYAKDTASEVALPKIHTRERNLSF